MEERKQLSPEEESKLVEEELKDLTVETNGEMPEYLSRMVGEYTELTYRIVALDRFLTSHEPEVAGEDGAVVSSVEYSVMSMQLMAMSNYAIALETRGRMAGYEFHVIEDPTQAAKDTPESEEE